MPRKKSRSDLVVLPARSPVATKNTALPVSERRLSFGDRWSYAPAPEGSDYIKLKQRYQLFIGGKFVAPRSGKYFDSINPATEEKLAEIAEADARDVDLRGEVGAKRLPESLEQNAGTRARANISYRIARLIQEKARELAVLETMDGGKTIKESRDIDSAARGGAFFLLRRLGGQARITLFPGGRRNR